MSGQKILLDTHIFIWMIDNEEKINPKVKQCILEASENHSILLSAISVWEIAMLVERERLKFVVPLQKWIDQALTTPGVSLAPLKTEILIESCRLPGNCHSDPADRMIIATARIENAILLTRDQKILQYAKKGHLSVLEA